MARYIVTVEQRSKYPLIVIEIIGISMFLTYWLCKHYNWDWIVGIVVLLASIFAIMALFFGFRIFRYIFSIAFSLFWGFLAFAFASSVSKSDLSHWIALIFVFFISLLIHYGYFHSQTDTDKL